MPSPLRQLAHHTRAPVLAVARRSNINTLDNLPWHAGATVTEPLELTGACPDP